MVQYFDYTFVNSAHHLVVNGPVVRLPNLLSHFLKLEFIKWLKSALRYNDFVSFAVLE